MNENIIKIKDIVVKRLGSSSQVSLTDYLCEFFYYKAITFCSVLESEIMPMAFIYVVADMVIKAFNSSSYAINQCDGIKSVSMGDVSYSFNVLSEDDKQKVCDDIFISGAKSLVKFRKGLFG